VAAGLADARVPAWHPAKYVAKLRACQLRRQQQHQPSQQQQHQPPSQQQRQRGAAEGGADVPGALLAVSEGGHYADLEGGSSVEQVAFLVHCVEQQLRGQRAPPP
jgi:hypothetical protein